MASPKEIHVFYIDYGNVSTFAVRKRFEVFPFVVTQFYAVFMDLVISE